MVITHQCADASESQGTAGSRERVQAAKGVRVRVQLVTAA